MAHKCCTELQTAARAVLGMAALVALGLFTHIHVSDFAFLELYDMNDGV